MPTENERVVFLITRGDSVGGAQIHVRDIATALKGEGGNPLVITGGHGPFTEELTERGISWEIVPELVRNMNPWNDLKAIRRIQKILRRTSAAILSTHTAKAGLVGRVAAWLVQVPAIFTAHGWQFAPGISMAQRLAVWSTEVVISRLQMPQSRVITVSRFDYELALRSGAVPKKQLRLVHNGLPWMDPKVAATERGDRSGPVRIVMIARFQKQKDHSSLLHALAELPVDLQWHLELVGEDSSGTDKVKRLSKSLNLDSPGRMVTFAGHRSDIPNILASADLYCLISHWEGLPRSIIEAMRASLPVIASDVGGNRELVVPEQTGYLVPRGDTAALTQVFSKTIRDSKLRKTLGSNGRVRYEKFFSFPSMMSKTKVVWLEIKPNKGPDSWLH